MNLSTLIVKNLVFSGIHGSTGREPLDSQRFRVSLSIKLEITRASMSDVLSDTYDYKHAVEHTRRVIEEEHHVLIEKIAMRIAERICQNPKVCQVKVALNKIDAARNGVPGIIVQKKNTPQEQNEGLLDFDIQTLFARLEQYGGASFPLLSHAYRHALLEEAESYQYEKQLEIVGPAKVREQLSSTTSFRPGSLFYRLKE